jgi:hypothetical protein
VKYLMDQSEAFAGLRAAAELSQVLGNCALASRAGADSDRMQAGFGPANRSLALHGFPGGAAQRLDRLSGYQS